MNIALSLRRDFSHLEAYDEIAQRQIIKNGYYSKLTMEFGADEEATVVGKSNPDKGLIEEIDPKHRAIFFTDEMSAVKKQMIDDELKPFQKTLGDILRHRKEIWLAGEPSPSSKISIRSRRSVSRLRRCRATAMACVT